jgi:hypothetical protein
MLLGIVTQQSGGIDLRKFGHRKEALKTQNAPIKRIRMVGRKRLTRASVLESARAFLSKERWNNQNQVIGADSRKKARLDAEKTRHEVNRADCTELYKENIGGRFAADPRNERMKELCFLSFLRDFGCKTVLTI